MVVFAACSCSKRLAEGASAHTSPGRALWSGGRTGSTQENRDQRPQMAPGFWSAEGADGSRFPSASVISTRSTLVRMRGTNLFRKNVAKDLGDRWSSEQRATQNRPASRYLREQKAFNASLYGNFYHARDFSPAAKNRRVLYSRISSVLTERLRAPGGPDDGDERRWAIQPFDPDPHELHHLHLRVVGRRLCLQRRWLQSFCWALMCPLDLSIQRL